MRAKEDPASEYCLPYAWGTVGIFYNETVTGPIAGWADFFAIPEKTGGKITLLDDMREVIAIGHVMNGTSVNSDDPAAVQAATDYVLARKGAVSAFTYEGPPLPTSGDIAAGHFFVGGNVFFTETPNIKYVIPAEGGTMYQENICVLASAPDKKNAMKFMEFYLRPEIAALNVAQQFNGTPNLPANDLTPEAIKSNPNINVGPETLTRLQIFEDIGAALKLYDRAWNTIRTAQGMAPLLEIRAARRTFVTPEGGHLAALDGIDLDVGANEFVTLLGPSGCGKTTLLRAISGFETLDSGSMRLDGADLTALPPFRRPVNTVFQSYALFGHMNVARNVGYALEVAGLPKAQRETQVTEALQKVGLAGMGARRPGQVSGGQRQRVALAPAIIAKPRLLLLE
ncbi:extracellular solute-binding protein [Rhodobacter sp. Har01]|nr:extracellular solute-binding protein [Rhodobacter sp. Har01]